MKSERLTYQTTEALQNVLQHVAAHYEISTVEITCKSRLASLVRPRHMFCFLATETTDVKLSEIGAFINRDHSTVIHGRQRILDAMQEDLSLKRTAATLVEVCKRGEMLGELLRIEAKIQALQELKHNLLTAALK